MRRTRLQLAQGVRQRHGRALMALGPPGAVDAVLRPRRRGGAEARRPARVAVVVVVVVAAEAEAVRVVVVVVSGCTKSFLFAVRPAGWAIGPAQN